MKEGGKGTPGPGTVRGLPAAWGGERPSVEGRVPESCRTKQRRHTWGRPWRAAVWQLRCLTLPLWCAEVLKKWLPDFSGKSLQRWRMHRSRRHVDEKTTGQRRQREPTGPDLRQLHGNGE